MHCTCINQTFAYSIMVFSVTIYHTLYDSRSHMGLGFLASPMNSVQGFTSRTESIARKFLLQFLQDFNPEGVEFHICPFY